MKNKLIVTKKHDTYFRDAVILALIGFVAGIAYLVIRLFIEWEEIMYLYIFSVASWIWILKQKFMPETYVLRLEDHNLILWRKGEVNEGDLDEKEIVNIERAEDGFKLKYKDFGLSNLKSSVTFREDEWGQDALQAIRQFVENHGDFDPEVLKSNAQKDARVSGFKSGDTVFAKIRYQPNKVPVSMAAYGLIALTVLGLNYYLSIVA